MQFDPLSQILQMIEARTVYAGGLAGSGKWAIRFPPPDKIKIFFVARGGFRLALDGIEEPFLLERGDVFLLTRQAPFTMASDLATAPRLATEIYAGAGAAIVRATDGDPADDDFLLLGSHIDTERSGGRLLIDNLPDFVHLPARLSDTGRLASLIGDLVEEAVGNAPGAEIACSNLAQLLLINILRRYLAAPETIGSGWLRAACDPKLAPALERMHAEPARQWSLPELARASAMSRTAFATHFKAVAGVPPLTYLTEWRMRQAERALRRGGSVATVARAAGYRSEAAFSTAYRRVMGRPPKRPAKLADVVAAE